MVTDTRYEATYAKLCVRYHPVVAAVLAAEALVRQEAAEKSRASQKSWLLATRHLVAA